MQGGKSRCYWKFLCTYMQDSGKIEGENRKTCREAGVEAGQDRPRRRPRRPRRGKVASPRRAACGLPAAFVRMVLVGLGGLERTMKMSTTASRLGAPTAVVRRHSRFRLLDYSSSAVRLPLDRVIYI